jgi:hypothetical protein
MRCLLICSFPTVCAPYGARVALPLTGHVHCAYCSALDPTPEHLEKHNHGSCQDGESTPRTFRRKDHLVQHLRLVHSLDTLPLIDDWKVESAPVVSRCGFCDTELKNWDERIDHLARHFRSGKVMADWRGDHGFDASVQARVTYAYPPYLIADQATTLVPFSVTSPGSMDHTNQLLASVALSGFEPAQAAQDTSILYQQSSSNIADASLPTQQEVDTRVFADILSRHLSQYARQQILMGIMPTDEMFQRESRRVMYHDKDDEDDEWNQTIADNPDWIRDFRSRMGFSKDGGI